MISQSNLFNFVAWFFIMEFNYWFNSEMKTLATIRSWSTFLSRASEEAHSVKPLLHVQQSVLGSWWYYRDVLAHEEQHCCALSPCALSPCWTSFVSQLSDRLANPILMKHMIWAWCLAQPAILAYVWVEMIKSICIVPSCGIETDSAGISWFL